VAIWASLLAERRAAAWARVGADGAAGLVVSPREFLAQVRGALSEVRVLDAGAPAACCGGRLLVEIATDELLFRALLHGPEELAREELGRLRPGYPPREASRWAVSEWNSRALDPLDPAGVLVLDARQAGTASPQLFVLWQDVDGEPRGWEALGELAEPRLLQAALAGDFRYAARDEELLVIDRSPRRPLGDTGPLAEELVDTEPFAHPPLPDSQRC
jgi:hypothetical protein